MMSGGTDRDVRAAPWPCLIGTGRRITSPSLCVTDHGDDARGRSALIDLAFPAGDQSASSSMPTR